MTKWLFDIVAVVVFMLFIWSLRSEQNTHTFFPQIHAVPKDRYAPYYAYTRELGNFTSDCIAKYYANQYKEGHTACMLALQYDPFNRQTYQNQLHYHPYLPTPERCISIPNVSLLSNTHMYRVATFVLLHTIVDSVVVFDDSVQSCTKIYDVTTKPTRFRDVVNALAMPAFNWIRSVEGSPAIDVLAFGPADPQTKFVVHSLMAHKLVARSITDFHTQESSFFLHKARLVLFLVDGARSAHSTWEPEFMVAMLLHAKMVVCEETSLPQHLHMLRKFVAFVEYKQIVPYIVDLLENNMQDTVQATRDRLDFDSSLVNVLQ